MAVDPAGTDRCSSDEEILAQLDTATPRTAWRIVARNRARSLFDQVREAESTQPLKPDQLVQARLIREGTYRAAWASCYTPTPREALQDWYSGAGIETAWSELHRADERLLLIQSAVSVKGRIAEIDAELRNSLQADDPRLTPAAARLKELANPDHEMTPDVREELRGYHALANTATDQAHANVRSLRNLLIIVGLVITVGLAVVCVLHAVAPGFLNLAGQPPTTGAAGAGDAVEVWEVVVVGALGGMIGAVFTISKLGGFSGPFRLPVYQALIRVPAGALVSLAAVLLVQSGQIKTLGSQSGLGVLVVALIFGYAPDVLLRIMDRKATSLLGQAQSKDDPERPPLAHPRAS